MRKICIVVLSRANYGRVKSVMLAIKNHPKLELQTIIGGSANLERFGNVANIIHEDGFEINQNLNFAIEGDELAIMSKTTGLGIIQISSALDTLRPDVVITVADRYETMATAVATAYQNIVLAHIQGGEVTGSIDESVRHAITKLSHIHFAATEVAKQNILKMGEDLNYVFNVGCPAMDNLPTSINKEVSLSELTGTGFEFAGDEKFNIVIFHPVTTSYKTSEDQTHELLSAVKKINKPTIWLWPNIDAGTDRISKTLRSFREQDKKNKIRFIKNLPVETYNCLLNRADILIGNSSSFIREASFLGTKAIIVGSRQNQREHGENVVFCQPNFKEILAAYEEIGLSEINPSRLYGNADAGLKIAEILSGKLPSVQKVLKYASK